MVASTYSGTLSQSGATSAEADGDDGGYGYSVTESGTVSIQLSIGSNSSVGGSGTLTSNLTGSEINDVDRDGETVNDHGSGTVIAGGTLSNFNFTGTLNDGEYVSFFGAFNAAETLITGTMNIKDSSSGVTFSFTATLTGTPPNQAPIVVPISATAYVGQATTIAVIGPNLDHDPDGDPLTFAGFAPRANYGTVQVSGNSLIYTPSAGAFGANGGSDTIYYTVNDGHGNSVDGSVSVTVLQPQPYVNFTAQLSQPFTSAQAGATIRLNATIFNNGTEAAPSDNVGVYISNNPTITRSDKKIGTYVEASTINAGGNSGNLPIDVTLPTDLNSNTYGPYYIAVIANWDQAVTESRYDDDVSGSYQITVNPVPVNPVAVADRFVVAPGVLNTFNILSNDTPANVGLQIANVTGSTGPLQGAQVNRSGNTVTYEYDGSGIGHLQYGNDSFSYSNKYTPSGSSTPLVSNTVQDTVIVENPLIVFDHVDPVPTLAPDATATMWFNFKLTGPDNPANHTPIDIKFETQDGTAVAGADYFAPITTDITVANGQSTFRIGVVIRGTAQPGTKTFNLVIQQPDNADLSNPQGSFKTQTYVGTIPDFTTPTSVTVPQDIQNPVQDLDQTWIDSRAQENADFREAAQAAAADVAAKTDATQVDVEGNVSIDYDTLYDEAFQKLKDLDSKHSQKISAGGLQDATQDLDALVASGLPLEVVDPNAQSGGELVQGGLDPELGLLGGLTAATFFGNSAGSWLTSTLTSTANGTVAQPGVSNATLLANALNGAGSLTGATPGGTAPSPFLKIDSDTGQITWLTPITPAIQALLNWTASRIGDPVSNPVGFNLTGNPNATNNDVIVGGSGNDTLTAGPGTTTVVGGGGNDTFVPGAGYDTFVGGPGSDRFVLNSAALSHALAAPTNVDRILRYDQSSTGTYNAAEGDQIDLSSLLSTLYAHGTGQAVNYLARAIEDSSGSFANLQIDVSGTPGSWVTIAVLPGLVAGNSINVILDQALSAGTTIPVAAGITVPAISVSSISNAARGQQVGLSSLVTISDPQGVAFQKLELWDSNGTAAAGQFVVAGSPQTGGHEIDVSFANVANTVFVAGTQGGTDPLWARLLQNNGQVTAWQPFTVTVPLPTLTVTSIHSAFAGESLGLALNGARRPLLPSLITISDPQGVGFQKLELWDSAGTVGGGQFVVNGVAQTGGHEIDVTPANIANTVFNAGTLGGTDVLWAQLLENNGQLTGWQQFTVSVPVPTLTVSNYSGAARGQQIALSTLAAVADPGTVGYQKLELWDSNGTVVGGQFVVNGVPQTGGHEIDLLPADVPGALFDAGTVGGTDVLWARLLQQDGTVTGWQQFAVTVPLPSLTVRNNLSATRGQQLPLSGLVSMSDPAGLGYQQLELWDSNGTVLGGQFVVNGLAQTGGHEIDVSAANVPSTIFDVGTLGGADTLWAQLLQNNGQVTGWQQFTVTAPAARLPTLTATSDSSAAGGQSITLSSLLTISDPDNVGYQKLELWDSNGTASGGQFVINGFPQTGGHEVDVTPANFANTVFNTGTSPGTDTLWAQLLEINGQATGWKQFTVTVPFPTLSVRNVSGAARGQQIGLSTLLTISDPANLGYQILELWDSNGTALGGQFVVNGIPQTGGHEIDVTPANVAAVVFDVGADGGSDTLFARLLQNDGTVAAWAPFSVSAPADHAPVASGSNRTLLKNATLIAASTLFTPPNCTLGPPTFGIG